MIDVALAIGVSLTAGTALMWYAVAINEDIEAKRERQDVLAIVTTFGYRTPDYDRLVSAGLRSVESLRTDLENRGLSYRVRSDASRWCAIYTGTNWRPAVIIGQCAANQDGELQWVPKRPRVTRELAAQKRDAFHDLHVTAIAQ